MGYESRLYVVNKTDCIRKEVNGMEMGWGEVIASFELCNVYDVSDKMRKYPAAECYIYGVDCEEEIFEDKYGSPLTEIPLEDAIEIIEEASGKDAYRRYGACLSLLKGFNKSEWEDLVVLHYGH